MSQIFALLLCMTCWQSCWGHHDALTYADACSDLGHSSESLHWATLRGIRRFFKNANKHIDIAQERISNASLSISYVRDTTVKSGFLATISHKGYSCKIGWYK